MLPHKKEDMWALSKMIAICEPKKKPQNEIYPDGTLILDAEPPEQWESKFLLSHPVYGVLLW